MTDQSQQIILNILQRVISKLTSGQFILTIIAGLVFRELAILQILPSEAVGPIITVVFMSYFKRERKNGNEKTN